MPAYPSRRRRARETPSRVVPAATAEALERRLILSAAPIGGEFAVNQTTLNNQSAAAVATDGDGDYVVAWESDQGGAGFDVYARRYNAAGIAQGGEFRVNTFTTGNQSGPAVAADADGDFLVAWTSSGQDGGGTGVYVQRYNAAGVAQGGEFRVNTTTTGFQQAPAVALDAAGDAVVAWQSYGQESDISFGVYAQRYDAAGVARGTEFRVNTFATGNQTDPSVASDAAGNVVVTWTSAGQDGGGTGVYAQRYDAAGAARGSEFRVNTTTPGDQSRSAVAAGRGGNFVVAWQSDGQDGGGLGVYAQRYNAAGVAQGTEFRANTTTAGNQGRPAVAADAAGDFVVTWETVGQDTPSSYGVYARPYAAAGAALTGEFRVNTTTPATQRLPAVGMDAAGDFVAAWQSSSQDGSGYGVYAQRYDESSDTAGPVVASAATLGGPLLPGMTVRAPVSSVTLSFDEALSTAGGTAGPNSATNPANWGLTYNGQDVSARITAVAFAFNPTTNRYEATLTFSPQLLLDGDYVLTARQAIRDTAGNALDGNFDGAAGGNFALLFAVHPVVPVGGEFRANTYTDNDQRYAAVASDAAGNFVVVWESVGQDGSPVGIYARRYDAAGVPQGGEFRVSASLTRSQTGASVAMDAAGDFVVAWSLATPSGPGRSRFSVYARRYNAAGNPQGDILLVKSASSTSSASGASVAMGAAGDFVIAWSGDQTGDNDVYAQRYDPAGVRQGSEFRVNTTTAGSQSFAAAAADAAGDFVIVWVSDDGIYARQYTAAGVARGGEFQVGTLTFNGPFRPAAAMDAAGDFVVAWQSRNEGDNNSGIYARRYDAAGVPQGATFRAGTDTTSNERFPAAAMDAAGNSVIAWQGDDGNRTDVYARRFSAAGVPQGGEIRADTSTAGDQRFPAAAMIGPAGDFVVAWHTSTPDSGADVYAVRFGANERPTTLGLAAVNTVQNVSPADINLPPLFADSADTPLALAYAVVADTNPGLFGSTPISAAGVLSLNLAANAAGAASITVRATDSGGLFVESTFAVTVRPAWLTVPSGGVWSITGTPTNYTLTLTSGNFTIPSDPATLNPNLNVGVTAPAALTVNADVHLAGLTLTGVGAAVTFNGPGGAGLTFAGGPVPLAVPVPGGQPVPPTPTPTPVPRDPPYLGVGDVSKAEGNAGTTAFAFPVTLDRAGDMPVRVYYATANVTAAHGTDYVAAGGVLTFQPGDTSKVITVRVEGDTTYEADERFRVVLYGATGAVVADDTGVGTIRNDDAPPPRVSVAGASPLEGDKGLRAVAFDVSLAHAAASAVVMKYATADGPAKAGSDYTAAAGTLTFRPGETRKRVVIYVTGDTMAEADETFFLDLAGPAGAARGRGLIRNDD